MTTYIDLHNHILPGIDDGPRTMNESVMLARAMVSVGYETVAVTPHSFEGRPTPALILERLADLQFELDRLNVPLKLLPGAEQHIEPALLERLEAGEILTLNRSRYLLLELPMLQQLPVYTEQLLFSLVANGYRPIIPHPERTVELQRNYDLIIRLHKVGAIFQVTWSALIGWIGSAAQKTARDMLSADMAHIFATDAHNAASRLLTINKASACLEAVKGPGAAEMMLTTRPRLVISDQDLDLSAPKPLAAGVKSKFSFSKKARRRQSP
jgi:protein-tyrosine phosphatase